MSALRTVGTIDLPPEATSGRAARRFAESRLPDLAEDDRDTVALLIAELVTNSLLHADGPLSLTLALGDEGRRLHVEVHDGSPVLPTRHDHGEDASTGRGMHLVDALSDQWGAAPDGAGKRVWFDLLIEPPSAAS